MKYNFPLILRIISILSTGTIFFSFIITNLCTNVKSPNFIEYTSLSKFFINFYIFVILLLCLLHSIYPQIICQILISGFGIISTTKGKIIIICIIDVMYFSTENLPQKLFGMITFVSNLALLLGNLIFNCEILNQKAEEENNEVSQNKNIVNAIEIKEKV